MAYLIHLRISMETASMMHLIVKVPKVPKVPKVLLDHQVNRVHRDSKVHKDLLVHRAALQAPKVQSVLRAPKVLPVVLKVHRDLKARRVPKDLQEMMVHLAPKVILAPKAPKALKVIPGTLAKMA